MTCCSGSSVSSPSRRVKPAFSSNSLISSVSTWASAARSIGLPSSTTTASPSVAARLLGGLAVGALGGGLAVAGLLGRRLRGRRSWRSPASRPRPGGLHVGRGVGVGCGDCGLGVPRRAGRHELPSGRSDGGAESRDSGERPWRTSPDLTTRHSETRTPDCSHRRRVDRGRRCRIGPVMVTRMIDELRACVGSLTKLGNERAAPVRHRCRTDGVRRADRVIMNPSTPPLSPPP